MRMVVCTAYAHDGDAVERKGVSNTSLPLQLDQTTDFEERRLIRAAMRELRQRKRGKHLEGGWGERCRIGVCCDLRSELL